MTGSFGMGNANMRLELRTSALKALKLMPMAEAKSLIRHMETLAADPGRATEIHPVEGEPGTFLFRDGEWVVMYELDTARAALYVELISMSLSREIQNIVLAPCPEETIIPARRCFERRSRKDFLRDSRSGPEC